MTATEGCSCGGCAGLQDRTPQRLANRPGLAEIGYRTGTYARFRESMIAGLTRADRPALADLRTRDPADFSLALIDAWAMAADVLTFYTERSANENYLGTATERRSVAGIVGLIGYRLGPGVAGQTTLAFALDTSPGSPTAVPIATGAKVQTLPGPGELPQTYETVDELTALAGWNTLTLRQTEPRVPQDGDTVVLLAGAATGVLRGDTLLFVADGASTETGFVTARVTAVAVDAAQQRTMVTFVSTVAESLGDADAVRLYVMRQRAALFGYNAPSPVLFAAEVQTALNTAGLITDDNEWAFADLDMDAVDLDGVYDGVTTGSPVLLRNGDATVLATLEAASEVARTAYGISAKVARLDLDGADVSFGGTATRGTVVLLRAEELTLAEVPVTAPIFGSQIELDGPPAMPELLPRPILLRGRPVRVLTPDAPEVGLPVLSIGIDEPDPALWHVEVQQQDGSVAVLDAPPASFTFTPPRPDDPVLGETVRVEKIDGSTLLFAEPLTRVYDHGVEIWGNVATGTHGESVVDEVLGSGDAAVAFQRFPLRRSPLTYTQAATASGGASTLEVFVNDVRWTEVSSLFGHGPRDRVFATTTTDDGRTVVRFGDGVAGARPPTGRDNIRARYRAGTGLAGLAKADQLSLLMTRPLGVKSVRNPLAAAGAEDSQAGADAADNAPRTVLTLERIVSLQDYADFAANVGGVGKATATWTWDGVARGVALTVAGIGGAPIDPADPLLDTLTTAVVAAGNARVPLVVRPAEVGRFALEGSLVLDPASVAGPVIDAARAALLDHFSFARRDFGQIVSLGEVDQVLHAVRGVTGVLVSSLYRTGDAALRNPVLLARSMVPGSPPPAEGAEVLSIDPEKILLGVAP